MDDFQISWVYDDSRDEELLLSLTTTHFVGISEDPKIFDYIEISSDEDEPKSSKVAPKPVKTAVSIKKEPVADVLATSVPAPLPEVEKPAENEIFRAQAVKVAYVLRKMLPMEWSLKQKKNTIKMSYPPLDFKVSCDVDIAFPCLLHVYINDEMLNEFHDIFKFITVRRHYEGKLRTEYIVQLMKSLIKHGFGRSTRKNLAVLGTRKRKMTLPVKNKPTIAFKVGLDGKILDSIPGKV